MSRDELPSVESSLAVIADAMITASGQSVPEAIEAIAGNIYEGQAKIVDAIVALTKAVDRLRGAVQQ